MYEYLDDVSKADVAFRATGATRDELFAEAAKALTNVMVADLATVAKKETREISVTADDIEKLLHAFLEEFIFLKDAEQLLFSDIKTSISDDGGLLHAHATLRGEKIDMQKHELTVEVKAVTWHKFSVKKTAQGWECVVVVDV